MINWIVIRKEVDFEMNLEFVSKLCVFVCSLAGFSYGMVVFLARKAPLYAKMITGAVGCMMFGSLLAVVRRSVGFEERAFQLDHLTYVGVFLFFFTANVGVMDGLADDGSKSFLKYRLAALAAPVLILLMYVPVLFSGAPTVSKVVYGIVSVFAAASSYFNFKHAIFPDVDFGVVRCVRSYNWLALASAFLYAGTVLARVFGAKTLSFILFMFICVDVVLILPLLKRGIEKWRI